MPRKQETEGARLGERRGLITSTSAMSSSQDPAYGTVEMSDNAAIAPLVRGGSLSANESGAVRSRIVPRRRGPTFCHSGQSTRERTVKFTGDRIGKLCLVLNDPVHALLNLRTTTLTLLIVLFYLLLIIGFAPIYLELSSRCEMGLKHSIEAYYFSLITISTIGYGSHTDDFGDCWEAGVVITTQWLLGALANACCLALVFMRCTRVSRRESTVVFSEKAVLREIGGNYYFSFQVVDVSPYVLTEAHVRCYAVHSAAPEGVSGANGGNLSPAWIQHTAMRIDQPDDERGAMLFLELPTAVVHRLDAWSPLAPPMPAAVPLATPHDAKQSYRFPDVLQRASDNDNGSRTLVVCECCGEGYENAEQLVVHQLMSRVDDRVSGHDVKTINMATGEAFASAELLRRAKAVGGGGGGESGGGAGASVGAAAGGSSDDVAQSAHSTCNHAVCSMKMIDSRLDGSDDDATSSSSSSSSSSSTSSSHGDEKLEAPLAEAQRIVRALRERKGLLPAPVERLLQRQTRDSRKISEWLSKSGVEVVVIVEGIEPITSATAVARHSYSWSHGYIALDHSFVPCVARPEGGGGGGGGEGIPAWYNPSACEVDLKRFHEIVPIVNADGGAAPCSHT